MYFHYSTYLKLSTYFEGYDLILLCVVPENSVWSTEMVSLSFLDKEHMMMVQRRGTWGERDRASTGSQAVRIS